MSPACPLHVPWHVPYLEITDGEVGDDSGPDGANLDDVVAVVYSLQGSRVVCGLLNCTRMPFWKATGVASRLGGDENEVCPGVGNGGHAGVGQRHWSVVAKLSFTFFRGVLFPQAENSLAPPSFWLPSS